MNTLLQDIRYGIRMLVKSPGFAAVAILTLALGIGANTAIFSLIDGLLLKSLPARDPQNLLVLQWKAHHSAQLHMSMSYGDCQAKFSTDNPAGCSLSRPLFDDLLAQNSVFSSLAAFASAGPLDLSGNGAATMVRGQYVSGEFFTTVGVNAAAGRLIAQADDTVNSAPVAVLRYGYWRTAFGGSPAAIGKSIRLNGISVQIVGVAEPKFTSLSPGGQFDVWVPLTLRRRLVSGWTPRQEDAGSWWVLMIGRVKPGISVAQAQSAVNVLFRNEMFHGDKPLFHKDDDPQITLATAPQALTGDRGQYITAISVLMIAVGIILLIACANVAGLLLSRATARQREMAVRLALGAGRRRIVRQLLTESVLLSLAGGALGILLAIWGMHAIVSLVAGNNPAAPLGFALGIDGRVLMFTLAVSVLTGIIFGLAPAFRSARVDLTPMLKEGTGVSFGRMRLGGRGGRWFSLGNFLVVAQVALAVVVLVGAGLLVRTLANLRSINPGFDANNVLLFRLDPSQAGYKEAQVDPLFSELQGRFAALPGVTSVSYSSMALLSGSLMMSSFHMPGTPAKQESNADMLPVGPGFFQTMRMRLLTGRDFMPADFALAAKSALAEALREAASTATGNGSGSASAKTNTAQAAQPPQPAIVNEAFVRKYLGKQGALGVRFGYSESNDSGGSAGPPDPGYIIVGVVGDAKYNSLRREVNPTVYVASSGDQAVFELRTAANPEALTPMARKIVGDLNSDLPLADVSTQTQEIDRTLFQERMIARLSSFFGLLALVLACIGLYGLLSYEVSRRTREIGIRMALGAQPGRVLRLVIGKGIALAVIGAMAGMGVALGITRYLADMLFKVRPADPLTLAGVAALLAIVALAACYIPARRATRVDPMVALRYE